MDQYNDLINPIQPVNPQLFEGEASFFDDSLSQQLLHQQQLSMLTQLTPMQSTSAHNPLPSSNNYTNLTPFGQNPLGIGNNLSMNSIGGSMASSLSNSLLSPQTSPNQLSTLISPKNVAATKIISPLSMAQAQQNLLGSVANHFGTDTKIRFLTLP